MCQVVIKLARILSGILISLYVRDSRSFEFRETSKILSYVCLGDVQKKGLGYHSELPSTDPSDLALTQLPLLDLTTETACYQFGRVMRKCFSYYLGALDFQVCLQLKTCPHFHLFSFAVEQAGTLPVAYGNIKALAHGHGEADGEGG